MFAQIEPMSQGMLGSFALAAIIFIGLIGGILGIAVAIKALLKREPIAITPENSPVTRIIFDAAMNEIKEKFNAVAAKETVTVLGTRVLQLEKEQSELEKYTRQSMHTIRNELQYLGLSLAVIATKLEVKMPEKTRHSELEDDSPCEED